VDLDLGDNSTANSPSPVAIAFVSATTSSAGSVAGNVNVTVPIWSEVSDLTATSVPSALLPPGAIAVAGAVSYQVTSVPVGSSIDVEVQLPPGSNPTSVYKLEGGSLIDVTSIATINGDVLTLHLTDGGVGDADGIANGVIVDPLVPARRAGSTPTITKTTPAAGPTAGGTNVTITGHNLQGATGVMFGSAAATSYTTNATGTTIIAVAPPEPAGAVAITVATPGGTATPSTTDRYTYLDASVKKPSPTAGPGAGGTRVTITGRNLQGATSVMFGKVAATHYAVNAAGTKIVAYAPAEPAGTVAVTITTPGGTATKSPTDQYTYLAPTLTKLAPTSGARSGGTKVTIIGKNLQGTTRVTFGKVAAIRYTVNGSGTKIVAYAPPEPAGTVAVTITTAGGTNSPSPTDRYAFT
jgi:hypothetical protein